MTFLVEVVVDRAVHGGELLQTSHAPEAQHRPFSPSKGLVAVLGTVVKPMSSFPFSHGAQASQRGAIGSQSVGDDDVGRAMPLERFPEEFQHRDLVSVSS